MNTIQPLEFPINGTATKLKVQVQHFATSDTTCSTYYELLSDENKICANGNYTLTEEEFTAWGQDNSYIDELIASKLGVVIIPETT